MTSSHARSPISSMAPLLRPHPRPLTATKQVQLCLACGIRKAKLLEAHFTGTFAPGKVPDSPYSPPPQWQQILQEQKSLFEVRAQHRCEISEDIAASEACESSLDFLIKGIVECTAKEAHSFLFPSHDDTHPGWHLVNTKTDYPKWIKLVVELAGFVESAIKALQDRTMEKIRREISKRTGEVVGMDLALYEIKYAEKNRKREELLEELQTLQTHVASELGQRQRRGRFRKVYIPTARE